VVLEVIVDSEGCPASARFLKPQPGGLAEQSLASFRWYAYQPARYQGLAVARKFTFTVTFLVS